MAKTVYIKTSLTGGAATALDGIDGSGLVAGDICLVYDSTDSYTTYELQESAGATERSPVVIIPDANRGNLWWRLESTPAYAVPDLAMSANPKALAQGVYMTAAESGSNGIQVADNDNIDFGTWNFTLMWHGNLADYTPSVNQQFFVKRQGGSGTYIGYIFGLDSITPGRLYLFVGNQVAGALNSYVYSSVVVSSLDNSDVMLGACVTRNPGGQAQVAFYENGIQLGAIANFTDANETLSNTSALYVSGSGSKRTNSSSKFVALFNRALTAAEVLALYRNGIDFSDQWGSQTSIITGNDSTFAGASNWANVDVNAYDETGDLTITASAIGQYCTLPVANATTVAGKRYRLIYDVANLVSTWTIKDFTGTQTIDTIDAEGTSQSIEFTASTTGGLRIVSVATDSSADIDNVYLYEIGATLALEPEGIQPSPGQWLDSSTNKLHALQPATGSSLLRRMKTFEVRWTNTWAGTHEAQYIGGVNQAVLPVGCYLTDIIGVVSGATIEDIIIGDGSDTDRWVEVTTGLAAGTTSFTLANRISDGTNYKLVVDPDNNFTGSIAWTIRGVILQ